MFLWWRRELSCHADVVLKKVTDVNAITGVLRYGYECWACDEHKDWVEDQLTLPPVIKRLKETK